MGLLELFITASVPVLNVLIVTGIGSFLATDYIGMFGDQSRKHLNNVVFFIFNPALVAINLSQTITWESMLLLWFMPINVLLTFIVGSVLGWVVIQITKAPSHLRGLILGSCSAGNMGNLFLIIIPAICKEKGSPFGAPDVCHTYGLAYASLSMALGAFFLWSYVYNILRISSTTLGDKAHAADHIPTMKFPEESTKLIQERCTYGTSSTNNSLTSVHCAEECAQPPFVSEDSPAKIKVPISTKIGNLLSKLPGVIDLRKLLAPSTIGVIVGFIVGLTPQIRKVMVGRSAPLHVIQDSAALLGDGAIPSVTLIMGGNLVKGLRGSHVRFSLIVGIIVVRYIILPLLGIFLVKGAVLLGLVHSDPLYQFVLMLQYAVPPAIHIGTMTQLFGAGESECSVIFLWAYALASVSLTLWSMLFMWLLS